jgi:hypothetical protein
VQLVVEFHDKLHGIHIRGLILITLTTIPFLLDGLVFFFAAARLVHLWKFVTDKVVLEFLGSKFDIILCHKTHNFVLAIRLSGYKLGTLASSFGINNRSHQYQAKSIEKGLSHYGEGSMMQKN